MVRIVVGLRRAFHLLPLKVTAMVCHITAFNRPRYVSSTLNLWRVFIIKGCSIFKCFFCIYRDCMIFIFNFTNVVYGIYLFAYVTLSFHPKNKSNLVIMYDPFNAVEFGLLIFC